MKDKRFSHIPVLVSEVLKAFGKPKFAHSKRSIKIIDATVGLGGHSIALVKSGYEVLGIDSDRSMLEEASDHLRKACPAFLYNNEKERPYKLVYGNFRDIDRLAKVNGFDAVSGILLDLGVSSPQLTSSDRGFSFQYPTADLDMRLDRESQSLKGSDLLNFLRQDQLIELFQKVISKSLAKKISLEIVKQREIRKITQVGDFLNLIKKVIKNSKGLDPATLPFLALRMAVNSEIENLEATLPKAFEILDKQGKLVIISFHSGEDKVVKRFFRQMSEKGLGEIYTRKPIKPKFEEIVKNPRARSAKMRILEKI